MSATRTRLPAPRGDRVVVCVDGSSSSSSDSDESNRVAVRRAKPKRKSSERVESKMQVANGTTDGTVDFVKEKRREERARQRVKKTKRETSEALLARRTKDRLGMAMPDPASDRERERQLVRIGTRGVVQLFNAVAERQSQLGNGHSSSVEKMGAKRKLPEELRRDEFERKLNEADDGGGRVREKNTSRTKKRADVKDEEVAGEDRRRNHVYDVDSSGNELDTSDVKEEAPSDDDDE